MQAKSMTVLEKYVESCVLLASSQSMKMIFSLFEDFCMIFLYVVKILFVVKDEYDIIAHD